MVSINRQSIDHRSVITDDFENFKQIINKTMEWNLTLTMKVGHVDNHHCDDYYH